MSSFVKQLESLNITPAQYMKQAKQRAKNAGLNPGKLKFSDKRDKKLDYDGVHFGAYGYKDYIIYSIQEKRGDVEKGTAREKRNRYQISHQAIKGNWKNTLSPNALSLKINW
jgi:hypothetical protein